MHPVPSLTLLMTCMHLEPLQSSTLLPFPSLDLLSAWVTPEPQSLIPSSFDNVPYALLLSLEHVAHLGSLNALPSSFRPMPYALPWVISLMLSPWAHPKTLKLHLLGLWSAPLHPKVSLLFLSALISHEWKIFIKHVRMGDIFGWCFLSMWNCSYRYFNNSMTRVHEEYQVKREIKGSIREQRTHWNLDDRNSPKDTMRSKTLWGVKK